MGGVDVDIRSNVERLRDEEEANLADLARTSRHHNEIETSTTGNLRANPVTLGAQIDSSRTRPPAQASTLARAPDAESFGQRVAVVFEGHSNASTLQVANRPPNLDLVASAISPSSRPAPFTSHSVTGTSAPLAVLLPHLPHTQPEGGELPDIEFTDLELSYIIRATGFLPGEDLLNGRGSEALGDFGRDVTESAMAREAGHKEISTGVHAGEIQVAEIQEDALPLIQTDIEMQPEGMDITVEEAARNVEKQTVEEERVPTPYEVIHNFHAGHVDEVCFPLLNSITLVHPKTFANFRCRSLVAGGSFLMMLYDSVCDWNQTPIRTFTPAMEQELQALSLDLAQMGFDLSWMSQCGAEVLAAARRREVQERICVLTDRLESAQK